MVVITQYRDGKPYVYPSTVIWDNEEDLYSLCSFVVNEGNTDRILIEDNLGIRMDVSV